MESQMTNLVADDDETHHEDAPSHPEDTDVMRTDGGTSQISENTASSEHNTPTPPDSPQSSPLLQMLTFGDSILKAPRTAPLPTQEEVPEGVTVLHNHNNTMTVYLLGTAHVSKESPKEVERLIQLVKPDSVLVELCASRMGIMYQEEKDEEEEEEEGEGEGEEDGDREGKKEEEVISEVISEVREEVGAEEIPADDLLEKKALESEPVEESSEGMKTDAKEEVHDGITQECKEEEEEEEREDEVEREEKKREKEGGEEERSAERERKIEEAEVMKEEAKEGREGIKNKSKKGTSDRSSQPPRKQKEFSPMQYLLSSIYGTVSKQLNITPGAEFRAAFQAAKKIGSVVILGDRPVEITLQRTWAALSIVERLKFMLSILGSLGFEVTAQDVERIKGTDLLTIMIKELGSEFPSILSPILTERDIFLTAALRACPGQVIVGVVGCAHIEGIKKYWTEPLDITEIVKRREEPKWKNITFKAILLSLPFLFLLMLYLSYYYFPLPLDLTLLLVLFIFFVYKELFAETTAEVLTYLEHQHER